MKIQQQQEKSLSSRALQFHLRISKAHFLVLKDYQLADDMEQVIVTGMWLRHDYVEVVLIEGVWLPQALGIMFKRNS